MAEIPVERKSSMAWLWVLLAVVLAALLLWWLLDNDDEAYVDPAAVESVESVEADRMIINDGLATDQAAAGAGVVTNISMLLPAISEDMVGRQVQLSGVRVMEPVSDAGFWIGQGPDQRLYAVLSEQSTPQTPTEGVADVNAGAMANLTGTIKTRQEALQGLAAGTNTDALPEGVDHFIVVESYQVQGNQ